MTAVTKGLPGALKDVRVLIAETPDGVRLPAGVDATSLQKLLSEAADATRRPAGQPVDPEGSRVLRGEGELSRNKLDDHEYAQARELADELGGRFEGQPAGNMPGIDGWYDGRPASLKTVSPDSKHPIKALAHAMTRAQVSLAKAGITDAVLIVRAPALTVEEILGSTRAPEIMGMGNVMQILVRGRDGWVRF